MPRKVSITTPLGDALRFRRLTGSEEISQLSCFEIDLVSDSKAIEPKALLGKHCTVAVETEGLGVRHMDGVVSGFGLRGGDHAQARYRMTLRPWLWLATQRSDFKVFQFMTVPDILDAVLSRYGNPMEKRLTRAYRNRDYTVQYHETDFNFVARLCEDEGIYWHIEHGAGSHKVVFADDVLGSHSPLPGGDTIPFHPPGNKVLADREHINGFAMSRQLRPGRAYLDDFDFKRPRADLSNMRQDPPGHDHDAYEVYEFPGNYTEFADGDTATRLRLEEHLSGQVRAEAQLTKRSIAPGYLMRMENHPREDQNRQYLVLRVDYDLRENPTVSSAGGQEPDQRFGALLHPSDVPFRPRRATPKPKVEGPLTATVVGPAGEEIWTDEHGRVKVQFHWDRVGNMDENSSCWMRVSSPWAGSNFGGVFIPRIGHEVIVEHIGGDPDFPIVTGCVYNASNMPPWALPANATQSGVLTRSSKGGAAGPGLKNGPGDANALRFEDKAGQEQLWLHAQKDQLTEVENDEDKWVGRDRRKTVDHDETSRIGHDRTETVKHDESVTVGHNRTEKVGVDETLTVGRDRTRTVVRHEKVTVGKTQRHTVGLVSMLTVGLSRALNIGAVYSQVVGVAMSTVVGRRQTVAVGQSQATTVGRDYLLEVGGGGSSGGGGGVSDSQTTTPSQEAVSTVKIDGSQIRLDAKKVHINGQDEVLLTCGGSTLRLTPALIEVLSGTVKLNC